MSQWQKEMTDTVGLQVKELRGDRAAVWLSARTEELGMKVSRSAISELESGKRRSISVAELFVLAAALEVPPALLLFPNYPDGQEEYLPGTTATSFDASRWLSGEVMPTDSGALAGGHRLVDWARSRHSLEGSIPRLVNQIAHAESEDQRKFWQQQLEDAEKMVRIQNREMLREGGVISDGTR